MQNNVFLHHVHAANEWFQEYKNLWC